MTDLYNLFINAGVETGPASWGVVIFFLLIVFCIMGILKNILFPKR